MQPFLRKRGTGRRGGSLLHQACHSHAYARPGKLVRLPLAGTLNARSTAASAAEGEARRRLARVASLCPELLPASAHYGSRSSALFSLLFLTGGAEAEERGPKCTPRRALFSFSPRLITPPPPAEQKHFQALPAHTGITFASPEEPGGDSGGERASAAPAASYLVVGGLPGGGVVVKEGGEASVF